MSATQRNKSRFDSSHGNKASAHRFRLCAGLVLHRPILWVIYLVNDPGNRMMLGLRKLLNMSVHNIAGFDFHLKIPSYDSYTIFWGKVFITV